MLILTPQDIQYCQLSYDNPSLDKTYSGISYQKLLFISVTSFAKAELKKAEAVCRLFCRQEQPLATIIVREEEQISVWVEARDYHLINPQIKKSVEPEKNNQNNPNFISTEWFIFMLPLLFL